jgi:hypothetical protein
MTEPLFRADDVPLRDLPRGRRGTVVEPHLSARGVSRDTHGNLAACKGPARLSGPVLVLPLGTYPGLHLRATLWPASTTLPSRCGIRGDVMIAGRRRGLSATMRRELKRRSAMIGRMKTDGRLDRNFLLGQVVMRQRVPRRRV